LLEYDDARSGSFAALGDVAEDKFVTLGLITTKKPELEPLQCLRQRVIEATRYIPIDRLGLSPQCGFASSIIGNKISVQAQRGKLQLLVRAAHAIWG
jgi:5-methyltetrahydropteroyltriglutamate--homocysteine methyltransferase